MLSIRELTDKVRAGARVSADEALELFYHAPLPLLGELADGIRASRHPHGIVTYIIDRNVNYTNVCVARCRFCAFYRDVGSSDGYALGFDPKSPGGSSSRAPPRLFRLPSRLSAC